MLSIFSAEHGIPVVQHLPGVGRNLQDHLEVYVQHRCSKPITLYKYQWRFPHHMIRSGLQWFLMQSGPASSAHLEAGGFIRSDTGVEHPDLQYHFLPSVVVNHGSGLGDCHAFQVFMCTGVFDMLLVTRPEFIDLSFFHKFYSEICIKILTMIGHIAFGVCENH